METRSWASSSGVAKSMRGNRARDTKPEVAVRRELHRRGFRFRVDYAVVPGVRSRADIAFTRRRIAVYIDGCFWHCCPSHGTLPATNADYWVPKLERNRQRDREVVANLTDAGWFVMRFWEHEDPADIAARLAEALGATPATS